MPCPQNLEDALKKAGFIELGLPDKIELLAELPLWIAEERGFIHRWSCGGDYYGFTVVLPRSRMVIVVAIHRHPANFDKLYDVNVYVRCFGKQFWPCNTA